MLSPGHHSSLHSHRGAELARYVESQLAVVAWDLRLRDMREHPTPHQRHSRNVDLYSGSASRYSPEYLAAVNPTNSLAQARAKAALAAQRYGYALTERDWLRLQSCEFGRAETDAQQDEHLAPSRHYLGDYDAPPQTHFQQQHSRHARFAPTTNAVDQHHMAANAAAAAAASARASAARTHPYETPLHAATAQTAAAAAGAPPSHRLFAGISTAKKPSRQSQRRGDVPRYGGSGDDERQQSRYQRHQQQLSPLQSVDRTLSTVASSSPASSSSASTLLSTPASLNTISSSVPSSASTLRSLDSSLSLHSSDHHRHRHQQHPRDYYRSDRHMDTLNHSSSSSRFYEDFGDSLVSLDTLTGE